jgi:diaminopimelate decarboxylase
MHHFQYQHSRLFCEEVPIDRIAEETGTPVYVYSERTIHRHVQVFRDAFEPTPHLICYAVKANSNINLLRRLAAFSCA